MKKDKLWVELKQRVYARDNYQCRLCSVLSPTELKQLCKNAKKFFYIIDPAHILRKSMYPKLKYEINNIVSLNRYSHSQLDVFNNPITGEYIGPKESWVFWKKILGSNQLEQLITIINRLNLTIKELQGE